MSKGCWIISHETERSVNEEREKSRSLLWGSCRAVLEKDLWRGCLRSSMINTCEVMNGSFHWIAGQKMNAFSSMYVVTELFIKIK
ncbi:hypothetical protein K504DRAFT_98051 [Pleomassaria siparia CBS 279.74]|uniref:Uncharacterized protein n=1 Tax=Pleomassaria siparia CBS 279.74 TaxID=1314801 RepID=A0A6G1JXM9_9PLEO|nr:hypothetical protein K504DRAFT_98051 [Pleomassaria siparia CBS 279.74]